MTGDELIVSKEAFMKGGLPEEVVPVEGLGNVRIRSISRAEYMRVRTMDVDAFETAVLAAGLLEPTLSEDEVRQWRESVMAQVSDNLLGEVLRISGLRKTAVEEAKQSFPEDGGS